MKVGQTGMGKKKPLLSLLKVNLILMVFSMRVQGFEHFCVWT